jgi:hypothetical protein
MMDKWYYASNAYLQAMKALTGVTIVDFGTVTVEEMVQ